MRTFDPPDFTGKPALRFLPPAVCDSCGRGCCTLDQAGIPCYHCGAGTFVHRGEWVFWWCRECRHPDPFCKTCFGRGVIATPRE